MEELQKAQAQLIAETKEKEKKAKEAAAALEKKKSELANQESKLKEASSRVDGAVDEIANDIGAESPVGKKPAAKPAPATPASNVRPTSALNNEKKQKLQPKFDKIKTKVEVAKEKA